MLSQTCPFSQNGQAKIEQIACVIENKNGQVTCQFTKWAKFLPISRNRQCRGLGVTYIPVHACLLLLNKAFFYLSKKGISKPSEYVYADC